MPSKIQLKLISKSGELLNMVTCHAGKISVFRATGPSDLRPYQRALSGADAKNNIEVLCDGAEYKADQHITIGFGETSPTAGRTVQQFLSECGVTELASDGVLRSLGLEGIAGKACSEISPDQEARLRLIAATCDPEKALVLNDPFEHISHQWRERAAELLSNYARSRKALIVIPCLSYRPECWIDNPLIERIEVGQTSQRTIGFGSANSQHNQMINELRDKLRADPQFGENSAERAAVATGAVAAGITAGMPVTDLSDAATAAKLGKTSSLLKTSFKIGSVLIGAGVGGWLALLWSRGPVPQVPANKQATESVAALNQAPSAAPVVSPPAGAPPSKPETGPMPADPARVVQQPKQAPVITETFLLDLYPAAIKAGILDTVRGLDNEQPQTDSNAPAPAPQDKQNSGNLFSLLEQAGSKTGPAGAQPSGYGRVTDSDDELQELPSDASDEERRRQEIRERFLEAIRRSAEEREAERAEYATGE
jgi:hypothetical protein